MLKIDYCVNHTVATVINLSAYYDCIIRYVTALFETVLKYISAMIRCCAEAQPMENP